MKLRLAELNIEVSPKDPYTERFCAGYLAEFDTPDLVVTVSDEEIKAELEAPFHPSFGYAECICIYRHIALALPRFDGFVFHASVLECDGRGYAFAAQSGTGKSTHTALWLKEFAGRAQIINGDKPILRLIDGVWYAFGTPWCGKERWGRNASAPLSALCFLERGAENRIAPIGGGEMITRLFTQILMPGGRGDAEHFLDLLSAMIEVTPCYLLHCNMDPEAAHVAYNGMNQENCHDTK